MIKKTTTDTNSRILNNEKNSNVFISAKEAREYLVINLNGFDADIASRIAHIFVESIVETDSIPGYRMHVSRWIIKNEDVDLIATLSPIAITTATAVADLNSTPAFTAAIATTISMVALLIRQLRNYSIYLTKIQQKLVVLLKILSKASAEDLAAFIAVDYLEVEQALRSLSPARTQSGEPRSIVEQDKDKNWILLNV